MKRLASSIALLAAALLLLPLAAQAQAFRTYLASYGNDGNAGCPVTAPCRLLPAALSAVLPSGEIWILDSANFNGGQVDIAKSVSILAVPGATASFVSVGNFPALTITTPGIKVSLRNVVIANNAHNPGTYGVQMTANSELSAEECVFANLVFDGINVTAGKVNVRNSMFRDNGNFAVAAYGGSVNISGSEIFGGYGGVDAQNNTVSGTTTINVTDTTFANQGNFGVHAVTGATNAVSKILVTRSTIYGAGAAGAYAVNSGQGSPIVMLAYTTLAGNQSNFNQGTGGTIKTLGNNYIGDGAVGDTGALTSVAPR